jgi:predicted RNA binding protein YcfA (HicA-like mRNA interferase family)
MPKLSPVSYKQLLKILEAEGFHCARTEGDHMVFTKPGIMFIIKNNLRAGGISRDRYFDFLGQ